VDFCLRAAHAGFRAAYVPSVEGTHHGGHSVSQIPDCSRRRYWYASLLRYSRKHFGRSGRGLVAGGVAAGALGRAIRSMVRFQRVEREQAGTEWTIARMAFVYPEAEPMGRSGWEVGSGSAGAADTRSRVLNEGSPSTENTERTLKRLHAR
jgi:GT2 family glycosyltransferase